MVATAEPSTTRHCERTCEAIKVGAGRDAGSGKSLSIPVHHFLAAKVVPMSTVGAVIHIVDDDVSVGTALSRVLRAAGYEVNFYKSADDLLENRPTTQRGCILLDVRMPGLNGTQLHEKLIEEGFTLPTIFLTGYGDIPTSVRAIKAGAEDFLSKPVPQKVLLETVERALKRYDEAHDRLAQLSTFRDYLSTLTPRQREVFNLVVRGRLNKQIAHDLGTSERTIKAHRHSIMQKFKVRSIAELVSIAERLGEITG